MTSKIPIAVSLLALTSLIIPAIRAAASPWGASRTPPPGDLEKISARQYGPSILTSRVVLAADESANEQDTGETWKGRPVITRTEGNGSVGGFLGTLLAIRGTVVTGIEGMLNGVVGGLFGGARPVVDEDAR